MKTRAVLDFSTPHLIRNDVEYDAVVAEVNRLLDENPREGGRADEMIEFLSVLVEDYDRKHFALPGGEVTPQEVVEFMLEARGLSRADLARVMGGKSRVSEFFSGGRALSMTQVVKLRNLLGIPADLLVAAPRAAREHRRAGRGNKTYAYGAKGRPNQVSESSARGATSKRKAKRPGT
jgi:HTH-type transcriptional regulator/antitoxin HigA